MSLMKEGNKEGSLSRCGVSGQFNVLSSGFDLQNPPNLALQLFQQRFFFFFFFVLHRGLVEWSVRSFSSRREDG